MSERDIIELQISYFKNEYIHGMVYASLSEKEKDGKAKFLLKRLAKKEIEHTGMWRAKLRKKGIMPKEPGNAFLSVWFFYIIRKIFGVSFMINILELDEDRIVNRYKALLEAKSLGRSERNSLKKLLITENRYESMIIAKIRQNEHTLKYTRSMILGLNDGIVEVLAAVSGFAALAAAPGIVVIGGIVVGISGTLSMTGGAYLAAKSHTIVSSDSGDKTKESEPLAEAYYTGVLYIIGALVPILPFLAGFGSYIGILFAIILATVVLSIASAVISVIGGTSIKRGAIEMVLISLIASLSTTFLGTIAHIYFNIII